MCGCNEIVMQAIPVFHDPREVALARKQLPSFEDVPALYLVRNENPVFNDASRLGVCLYESLFLFSAN